MKPLKPAAWAVCALMALSAVSCGLLPEDIPVNRSIYVESSETDDTSRSGEDIMREPPESSEADREESSAAESSSVPESSRSESSSKSDSSSKAETKEEKDADKEYAARYGNPYVTKIIDGPMTAYVPNDAAVKYLGRVTLADDILWCAQSGTGAEFTYTGRNLEIEFTLDSSWQDPYSSHPRVAVFVNGERVLDEVVSGTESYPVIKTDEPVECTVRVVKCSEGAMSALGISAVVTGEDETIDPTPASDRRIEFIGDSICCGYGVDGGSYFSTATEDFTKTYGYLTAQALGADYSAFCISGYGVYSGYTTAGVRNGSAIIPPYYCFMGESAASYTGHARQQETGWSFDRFQPDAVVINLGTNDATYFGSDPARQQEFIDAYVQFLYTVREKNPDAEIVCMLGTCSEGAWGPVQSAVNDYSSQSGDTRVHSLLVDSGWGAYSGTSGHPNADSHYTMSEGLTPTLRSLLGW